MGLVGEGILEFQASKLKQEGATNIAAHNVEVARIQEVEAVRRRIDEAGLLRRRAKRRRARNVAKGAPLLLLQENAMNSTLDQIKIIRQGFSEGNIAKQRGEIAHLEGKIARRAGVQERRAIGVELANKASKAATSLFAGGF